jgi:uncharacterized protein (TIGR02118 family)
MLSMSRGHFHPRSRIPTGGSKLRHDRANEIVLQALAGIAPHLIAILNFDSMADLNAALASPEGQAAAADLSNFASAGAILLIYDIKAVWKPPVIARPTQ